MATGHRRVLDHGHRRIGLAHDEVRQCAGFHQRFDRHFLRTAVTAAALRQCRGQARGGGECSNAGRAEQKRPAEKATHEE
jgi:hypothetical protein